MKVRAIGGETTRKRMERRTVLKEQTPEMSEDWKLIVVCVSE